MLDKTFNPKDVEQRISALWEASGAFRCGNRAEELHGPRRAEATADLITGRTYCHQ